MATNQKYTEQRAAVIEKLLHVQDTNCRNLHLYESQLEAIKTCAYVTYTGDERLLCCI